MVGKFPAFFVPALSRIKHYENKWPYSKSGWRSVSCHGGGSQISPQDKRGGITEIQT